MIFVDTSVWVAAFRGDDGVVGEVGRLLDDDLVALATPVKLEILSGARRGELGRLRHVLGALPTFSPHDETWTLVESWVQAAVRAGERFGVVDLLIGAIAKSRGGSVWSLDGDFARMAKMRFVKVHRPRIATSSPS